MALKKEQLDEWRKLEERRKELSREAKTLGDAAKQLEEIFEAELAKSEKPSIKRHGYTLAWQDGRASVAWAAEYLKECGADKANALKQSAADTVEKKLSISPPGE